MIHDSAETDRSDTAAPVPYPPAHPVRLPVPMSRPLWTFILLGINAVVFLAMTAVGGSENPSVLIAFGAKFNPLIVAGQYWRLLTACFIHIGIVHLLFNSYALYSFGVDVERRFGRRRFLMLYLLAGLAGSVLSFLGNKALSAGASGAIFGLVGATTVYFVRYRRQFGQFGRRHLTNLLIVVGYNLFWGFINPGIDNLGHVGGLLVGLGLGWVYSPVYRGAYEPSGTYALVDGYSQRRAWLASLAVALLLVLLTSLGVWMQG